MGKSQEEIIEDLKSSFTFKQFHENCEKHPENFKVVSLLKKGRKMGEKNIDKKSE